MKIAFTGGGTAGHAMVNKILIAMLDENKHNAIYIGSKTGIEKKLIKEQGIASYFSIHTGKLRRYFAWRNVSDFFRVLQGIFDSYSILSAEKPQIIFSGGGFVSVPVILAGHLLGIPVIIRETDFSMGLANKICVRFAKKLFITFPDTFIKAPDIPCEYHGIIVRPELLNPTLQAFPKFTNTLPTLLVLGGSLGSEIINHTIRGNLTALSAQYNILHICGAGNLDDTLINHSGYRQYEFVDDIGSFYAASDVVITRCGSNVICECLALGKRTVCIPISNNSSRGEQTGNALYAVENGCAVILEEQKLTALKLLESIHNVLTKPLNPALILSHSDLMEHCRTHIEEMDYWGKRHLEEAFLRNLKRNTPLNWEDLTREDVQTFLALSNDF